MLDIARQLVTIDDDFHGVAIAIQSQSRRLTAAIVRDSDHRPFFDRDFLTGCNLNRIPWPEMNQ